MGSLKIAASRHLLAWTERERGREREGDAKTVNELVIIRDLAFIKMHHLKSVFEELLLLPSIPSLPA